MSSCLVVLRESDHEFCHSCLLPPGGGGAACPSSYFHFFLRHLFASVIVPVYNEQDSIRASLDALQAAIMSMSLIDLKCYQGFFHAICLTAFLFPHAELYALCSGPEKVELIIVDAGCRSKSPGLLSTSLSVLSVCKDSLANVPAARLPFSFSKEPTPLPSTI